MEKKQIGKYITIFSILCLGSPVSTWAMDTTTNKTEETTGKAAKMLDSVTNTPLPELNTVESTTPETNAPTENSTETISSATTSSSEVSNEQTKEAIESDSEIVPSTETTDQSTNSSVTEEGDKNSSEKATKQYIYGDYEYSLFQDTIFIEKYTGSNPDITIPTSIPEYPDKQVSWNMNNFQATIGNDKITSISFDNTTGKNTNLFSDISFKQFTSLRSFDSRGSELSKNDINTIDYAFQGLKALTTVDLSSWDTSKIYDLSYLFDGCSALENLTLSDSFKTSQVTTMSRMFNGCSSLKNADFVKYIDTSGANDLSYMFGGCSSLTDLDVSHFNTSNVTNMQNMFGNCRGLTSLDVTSFDTRNVTNMAYMFNQLKVPSLNLSNFNTSKVEYMQYMFNANSNLTDLDIRHFDTSSVKNMQNMFAGSTSLTSLDVSQMNTSSVENMSGMFSGLNVSSLDVSKFDTTNVTNMSQMFANCTNLSDLNLKNFNTASVTTMENMFKNVRIPVLDLSSFNASGASVGMMFWSDTPTTLFVLTDDEKLKGYDYASSNRLIGGPKFQGNGGKFDNQKSTKTYFDSCAISPTDPKLQLATFQQFKQDLKPTKDTYLFESWKLTEGSEPAKDADLFNTSTYTAQWTPSLENGNIPSQDVDNVKPGTTSIYGIAYMPKAFTIPSTKLTDETTQNITISSTSSYHVAVRDQRMTQGGWTLQAQLVWNDNALEGSYIQTNNGKGEVKKNTNTGSADFQLSDLIGNDGTVTGEANVKISTTPTTIMTGQNVSHNGVYDLGQVSLVLENANTIQSGSYKGNINWNLTSAP